MNAAIERLLAAYDDHASLDRACTIPAAWYTDPAIELLERERVFGRVWQMAGRSSQVARPGQFFSIELAGEPLLVARGDDAVLRAFFNVCRHHAAAVAMEESGTANVFRCPYHGWTYGLDGRLKGTPDFTGVCDFNRDENGLRPVRVKEWNSFVFVSLGDGGPELTEFLGDLAPRVSPLGLTALRFHSRREYTLRCNWKVFVDNYLDGGYHVPYLHKGLNSVLEYAHYTIENGERFCLQSSPMVSSGAQTQLESTRTGDKAYYFWLYPNFMINAYQGVMDTNLVLPLAVDRTRVIFDFYFADYYFGENATGSAEESIAVSDVVQLEDKAVCEAVQRGLGSRAYGAGRLSVRREAGEHLFHRLLAKDLKDPGQFYQLHPADS